MKGYFLGAVWGGVMATVLFLAFGVIRVQGQTKIQEDQLKLNVRVVEWQKCVWQSEEKALSTEEEPVPTKPLQDCNGLILLRIQTPDGSIVGPIIGSVASPDYKHDPAKWETVYPEVKP